jgi:hypothetical protein
LVYTILLVLWVTFFISITFTIAIIFMVLNLLLTLLPLLSTRSYVPPHSSSLFSFTIASIHSSTTDGIKLLFKELILPLHSNHWLFLGACV